MLHHVTLEVAAPDADRFAELLGAIGFAAVAVPESLGDGYRWFERGGTQVHLAIVDAPVVPAAGHPAFVVARLAGLVFAADERRRHWGARRVVVTAPGGHRVELMEAAPGRG